MSKIGQLRHVSESKWDLKSFFKPKVKPNFFLLHRFPVKALAAVAPTVAAAGAAVAHAVDPALVVPDGRRRGVHHHRVGNGRRHLQ